MKKQLINRIWFIMVVLIGIFLIGFLALWLNDGGMPINGPSGEKMPVHITKVVPYDGETVTSARSSYCVNFEFRAGNGMGANPNKSVNYFFDGIDVTHQTNGLITQDVPPSGGVNCFYSGVQFSEGWHTAKVTYTDVTGERFTYLWRFQETIK